MSNYKRILVALDFSNLSDAVLNRLQVIIKDKTTHIYFLHVVDDHLPQLLGESETEAMHYAEGWEAKEIKSKADAKSELEELISKYKIKNTQCMVELGTPRHSILSIAESKDIDLIVVGTHGVHGWKKLLGTTAEHVLHNARCDVLSIRAQEKRV